MRSTFTGFNSAVSGLNAAQRALDVIMHNVANQNTRGYSRQRVNQATAMPVQVDGGKWLGTGTRVTTIEQIRDIMLDSKYRSQLSKQGYHEEAFRALSRVEDMFQEPLGKGITVTLNIFFESINKVLTDPEDPTARSNFMSNARVFAQNMNAMARELEYMIADLDEDIKGTVSQVNNYTKQIASLNKLIMESEMDGHVANDYRDTRALLLDELSELVNIRVSEKVHYDEASGREIKKLLVSAEDGLLVDHDSSFDIGFKTNQDHPLFTTSQENTIPKSQDLKNVKVSQLIWNNKVPVDMNTLGGKLGSMVQMRDSYGDPNMGTKVKGVAYYSRMLNEFTRTFAEKVNEIHKKGFDKYGNPGEDIFVVEGVDSKINARNITVNSDIVKDVSKLAVGTNKDESNNLNFMELYHMRDMELEVKITQNINSVERTLSFGKGNPEDIFKSQISSVLGVEAQESNRLYQAQKIKVMEVDYQRMAVSGVSENEEMTNMMRYQHAYNASARMITTMDEMLDVIVNRMGRVGL